MAKEKHYYLIAEWNEQRGTTEQNPSSLHGTGSYLAHLPLSDIKPYFCYTSETRAMKVVAKQDESGWRWGYKHKLVKVPASALMMEEA